MNRLPLTAIAALVLLAGSACGIDDEEALDDLEQLSGQVLTTGGEVVDALEEAGLEVESAVGQGDYCQMEPAPGLTFLLGGSVSETEAYAEQHAVALEALQADGWEVTDEGEYAQRGERPKPYSRLSRDDYRLSLDNTVREGSDALVFGLRRDDDCIRVSDGSVQLPDDLKEIPFVE
ncbi:hypothetical protein NOK12_11870 [Nocardioides sp. OK12]|uniref:hypothetical protein n=1 Tax=Nocardioides sp. OK12 TaxID=2758661 RepID=UPI0021C49798|nr:hypothetical protein [Nocardioides sp. OK12]GHJ58669.1 hypothetical protein NOK12_11870 [Nocardioides sp. OK12]